MDAKLENNILNPILKYTNFIRLSEFNLEEMRCPSGDNNSLEFENFLKQALFDKSCLVNVVGSFVVRWRGERGFSATVLDRAG